ncbi:MAG: fumarate hydratase [Treponema sp.]|jgi:fumarate hydratase subunit alpha|nr:fumarate hydratase [Treponema sp.]
MREINVNSIIDLVQKLCVDANCNLNRDIEVALNACLAGEESALAKDVIGTILENAKIAREEQAPICQDTGMAVVFVELGTGIHICGDLEEAINEGVRRGYEKGYLRKSVVRDPIDRVNTKDNTPAVIHYSINSGDKLKIIVAPKGAGSENMSALKMLKPSDGIEGITNFVIDTVSRAGPNPCPPILVGVGVGGTMEKCALLSKKALLRPVGSRNADDFWDGVEKELLEKINSLGIGPAGFGGRTTALCVNIETFPTHIAELPVAVNIGCHVTRHAEGTL